LTMAEDVGVQTPDVVDIVVWLIKITPSISVDVKLMSKAVPAIFKKSNWMIYGGVAESDPNCVCSPPEDASPKVEPIVAMPAKLGDPIDAAPFGTDV
jgi:hypothetical protein